MNIPELHSEAESGRTVAQGILGILYLYGDGVPQDFAAARRWLTAAVERGASRPLFHLGRMHEEGWGMPVDYPQALRFYQRAADRGEWLAYVHLARLHRHGRGTVSNAQTAREWYQLAVTKSANIMPGSELDEAREYVASHPESL